MNKYVKKIAVIGLKGLPAFGGTATVGENIISELKDQYDFTVYAISSHTKYTVTPGGIRQIVIRQFPIKKLNIFYYYLASAFHAVFIGRYDLIHLHLIDGAYILPLLKCRYKVISTSHGRPQTIGKWNNMVNSFFKINEWLFLKFSDIITSVSLPLGNVYKGLTSKNIVYIPNGIKPMAQELNRSDRKEDYILFSARRLIEIKGCHLLIQALKLINFSGAVKIIGDIDQVPAYKEKLLNLSKDLDLVYMGLITDKNLLMQHIRNSKLFIFPSLNEAMSIMLLEVASVKTPLICSDIPENTAIFNNNQALFFRSGDPADLAEKISWALINMDLMMEKANQAYEYLNQEYTWDHIATKYDLLFRELL